MRLWIEGSPYDPASFAELDLKDPVVLQEQLIGVDVAYFSTDTNILYLNNA